MSTQVMTPAQFVEKWHPVQLPERAASQEHFIDLCNLLGQSTPATHDKTGAEYAFEKGVAVATGASKGAKGEYGYADAWWRGKFAWEYKRKGKYKDLADAYRQLCKYREALENPPLLVVCDIARTEIHTNFTGTAKSVHVVTLEEINTAEGLDKLRRVFADPQSFKPTQTAEHITRDVAEKFARLSQRLEGRKVDPHAGAHFLMKCMFCLFAEDIGLLPGEMFKDILQSTYQQPERFTKYVTELFAAIAKAIDAGDKFEDVPEQARPLIRQSAIMAAAAKDARLKKRTLTNLYNERPTWLRLAHEKLDRAVLAAYAAVDPEGGWSEDWAEVWRETGAGQPLPAGHELATRRAEVDQRVLGNLLRLNQARASTTEHRT